MTGQIDYMTPINHETLIVGSTIGQVGIYNSSDHTLIKMLVDEGLSVYEVVVS